MQELKFKNGGVNSGEIKKELENLKAQNDDLRERVKNLEYIMVDDTRRIKVDYQKEQRLVDRNDNFLKD